MTHQVLPEHPVMTDTDDDPPPHRRRKKSFQDWVTTTGGIIAILAFLGGLVAWMAGFMPWLRIDVYAQDKVAADMRVAKVEMSTQQLNAAMTVIQRNGLLTLQLQLQQRVDSLTTALKTIPPGSATYNQLSTAYYEAAQQLAEVNRQLGR